MNNITRVPIILGDNFTNDAKEWINDKFGTIHTIMIGGDIWFIGKEIAEVLKYKKPWDAIKQHVDKEDKYMVSKKKLEQMAYLKDYCIKRGILSESQMGGVQKLTLINEAGMYSLILQSKMKSARKFKNWVTHEVLPSIRKYGAYITPEKLDTISNNPDEMKKLVENLQQENESLKSKITNLTPLAEYTTKVLKSDEALPITLVAKEYGMTAQAFNKLLNKFKILFKKGKRWNPYKTFAPLGWFMNQTYEYEDNSNKVHTTTSLYVTQLGRNKLREYLDKRNIHAILHI